MLWLGKGKPRRFQATLDLSMGDFEQYTTYRKKYLAPWLHATLKRLYPQETSLEEGGDAYGVDDFTFPNWHLTPEGLYVSPSLGRAGRAGEYPGFSTIPCRLVRQHPGALKLRFPQ